MLWGLPSTEDTQIGEVTSSVGLAPKAVQSWGSRAHCSKRWVTCPVPRDAESTPSGLTKVKDETGWGLPGIAQLDCSTWPGISCLELPPSFEVWGQNGLGGMAHYGAVSLPPSNHTEWYRVLVKVQVLWLSLKILRYNLSFCHGLWKQFHTTSKWCSM